MVKQISWESPGLVRLLTHPPINSTRGSVLYYKVDALHKAGFKLGAQGWEFGTDPDLKPPVTVTSGNRFSQRMDTRMDLLELRLEQLIDFVSKTREKVV